MIGPRCCTKGWFSAPSGAFGLGETEARRPQPCTGEHVCPPPATHGATALHQQPPSPPWEKQAKLLWWGFLPKNIGGVEGQSLRRGKTILGMGLGRGSPR